MSIKRSSAKAKGRNLQLKICQKIADLFNINFDNQDEQCIIHSREMGQSGIDIILRGKIYEEFPFDMECKAVEKPSIKSWIKQAKKNTKKDRNWLLFWKSKDWHNPIVLLDCDEFFNLLEKIYKK